MQYILLLKLKKYQVKMSMFYNVQTTNLTFVDEKQNIW